LKGKAEREAFDRHLRGLRSIYDGFREPIDPLLVTEHGKDAGS
jgi:hypothetical protein